MCCHLKISTLNLVRGRHEDCKNSQVESPSLFQFLQKFSFLVSSIVVYIEVSSCLNVLYNSITDSSTVLSMCFFKTFKNNSKITPRSKILPLNSLHLQTAFYDIPVGIAEEILQVQGHYCKLRETHLHSPSVLFSVY